jgi:3-isopropylmalate/(R)-2-methylmalate dehydratase small subunit
MTASSRVWKFGDDINTDLIIPGRYLDNYDSSHLAAHAMEGASKDFAENVSTGDIIVAGKNFGCGSSREQAVIALKHAGVSVVVAGSFARIFYRNAINLGLPVMLSRDAHEELENGDRVEVDLEGLTVKGPGRRISNLEPLPDHLQEILDCGGLVPYIKARL